LLAEEKRLVKFARAVKSSTANHKSTSLKNKHVLALEKRGESTILQSQ